MIYVREDIPSDQLSKHNIPKKVEAIFVEINLRKNKFLLVGAYHSTSSEFGTSSLNKLDVLWISTLATINFF